jgi:basic amino acid/polyamine antiporter, APA family
MTSVILTVLYGQTRILFAIARDGLLPQRLAAVSPRTGAPVALTWLVGAVVVVLAAVVPLHRMVDLVNVGTLCAFTVVDFAVIVLRRSHPALDRPFRVPLMPLFPLLGIALSVYLMTTAPRETWIELVVWLSAGAAIYGLYGRRRSRRGGRERGRRPEVTAVGAPAPSV